MGLGPIRIEYTVTISNAGQQTIVRRDKWIDSPGATWPDLIDAAKDPWPRMLEQMNPE